MRGLILEYGNSLPFSPFRFRQFVAAVGFAADRNAEEEATKELHVRR
jgi:hypothetical protein